MDQTTQPTRPTGNFFAPTPRYKRAGDDKPIFAGKLTRPDGTEEYPVALWSHDYAGKDGEVKTCYSGKVGAMATNVSPHDQIRALTQGGKGGAVTIANLTLEPGQVLIFENGFKDEAPDANRPDLRGWVNPGDGTPAFQISAWIKQFEDSKTPYLSGTTQYPLSKSEVEQAQMLADRQAKKAPAKDEKGDRS